jgi:hypothetical protein
MRTTFFIIHNIIILYLYQQGSVGSNTDSGSKRESIVEYIISLYLALFIRNLILIWKIQNY